MELPQLPRCIHFQSKSLAVFGEGFKQDPDDAAGLSPCWCVQTSRSLGPDHGPVSWTDCSNPERDCYAEY
jgi:hypothetical protein